jgi:CysZ protein
MVGMILNSFTKTFRSLLDPSVLFILLVPFLFASLLWCLILFLAWGSWTDFLVGTAPFHWLMGALGDNVFLDSLKFLVIILGTLFVFGPLWYLTYILLISAVLFPLLLPRVQKKFYPGLEKKRGGHIWGSLQNTFVTTLIFIVGYGLSLPLWFFTPLSPVITLLLTAYLDKQLFTYDVLQEFASKEERMKFSSEHSQELWILGILTALLTWVPFANMLAPAITALAFIHFNLGQLQKDRARLAT